jgi:predicted PurR-regulated permease PerM
MEERHKTIVLAVLLLLFAYWSYLLLSPFLSYAILGLLLAFLFQPLYRRMASDLGETFAAALSIIIVLLIIILPSIWIATTLVTQTGNAYQMAIEHGFKFDGSKIATYIQSTTGFDMKAPLTAVFGAGKDAAAAALPKVITITGGVIVGFVVFFFVFYYALKEGREWYVAASNALPIRKNYKKKLQHEIESMTKALFYGQILTALLIGIGTGIIFMLFGIPNAVFWGFLMMILALLPLLGAPIVYVPAGIILMVDNRWVAGISVIILCTLVVFLIEYIVRPKFVSRTSEVHPLTVIIGALGGIYLLGFVGFLIGPLILGIFFTLLGFDYSHEG